MIATASQLIHRTNEMSLEFSEDGIDDKILEKIVCVLFSSRLSLARAVTFRINSQGINTKPFHILRKWLVFICVFSGFCNNVSAIPNLLS